MSTTETAAVPAETPHAMDEPGPPVILSQTLRRSGRKRTRVLAVASLLGALGATGYVISSAIEPDATPPIAQATDEAWKRLDDLSDALRELRPGGSRNEARPLAGQAARAVANAQEDVEALALPTAQTPLRSRVLEVLRSDAAWVDAVGSTLANPRSPRRAELAELAKAAALDTSLVSGTLRDAKGTVGGTGRLLSATKPA